MRPQPRHSRRNRHITLYQYLAEGMHGGRRRPDQKPYGANRQLELPILMAAYLRTANRSRSPPFTRARRAPKGMGRRNGNVSTAPSVAILPFSETAARRPGTGSALRPSAVNMRPDADSGEPKTWAPK